MKKTLLIPFLGVVLMICTSAEPLTRQIKPAEEIPYVEINDDLDPLRIQYRQATDCQVKSEQRIYEALSKTNELLKHKK